VARRVSAEETGLPPWPECYEGVTPESIAYKRAAFKNPDKLKAELLRFLPINGRFDFTEFPWFKKTFDVQDEVLRPVLLEIYKEASLKDLTAPNNHVERLRAMRSLTGLGICADNDTKQLLLSRATEVSDVRDMRMRSLAAYLQAADPEETKNALLRFLVEGDRMDSMARLGVYEYARMAYDVASPEKKAAILAALITAANKEEGKIEFMKVDKILAERSATYRYSRERLAMLERHSLAPPTTNLYTDRDLKAALQECRKYKTHTNISTNLADLKTRNFNVPQPDLATNDVIAAVESNAVAEEKTDNGAGRSIGMYMLLGIPALLLLGFGAWKMARK
jgi:hypothetical protein